MIGREGPGPERPGPDYPPEWDLEPDPDGEYHDEVLHPTYVGGCADCDERADALEQQRPALTRPSPEPNDGPGPDGHHLVTGECFACLVGVATGPESHGDRCSNKSLLW